MSPLHGSNSAHYLGYGGDNNKTLNMHEQAPTFQQGLKQFIRNSKAFIKLAGIINTKQAVQAYKGTELLLRNVGIFMRAPAVASTLCLAHEISNMVFNMIIDIRKANKEGTSMLKGSSLPLPRKEPWATSLEKKRKSRHDSGSPSIPTRAQNMIDKAREAITIRGEAGDRRDVRTSSLLLACPRCANIKDVACCTLFKSRAIPLQCRACQTSTTSSIWQCSHGLTWLQCPFHREDGFRCQSGRKARHTERTPDHSKSSFKAKFRRLKRLGHLGLDKQKADDYANSIGASSMPKKTKKNKKTKEVIAQTTKSGGMRHDRPSFCDSDQRSGSLEGTNQSVGAQTKKARIDNRSSGSLQASHPTNQRLLINPSRGDKPSASSAKASCCVSGARGGCPKSWTIDLYCEVCHG